MSVTTTTESTDHFVSTQTIIPAWQRMIIDAAYDRGVGVVVTRKVTPAGTFVVGMDVEQR